MKALQSLTKLFTLHVTDAKNLEVWAEDGELICTQGNFVDGFDIAYTVNINMTGVDVEPHILMMHLVTWFNKFDVNREEKGLPAPSFATQLLDKGKCDIKLKVDIQESFSMDENKQGNWKQGDIRYECISDFQQAVNEGELPPLEIIKGPEGDCPSCN